jgi:WD40 repeat protein
MLRTHTSGECCCYAPFHKGRRRMYLLVALMLVATLLAGCGTGFQTTTPVQSSVISTDQTPKGIENATVDPQPQLTITSEPGVVLSKANEAFAAGMLAYLYDPQPKTVEMADIKDTAYTIRYIVSPQSAQVPSVIILELVDLQGNKESTILWNPPEPDWVTRSGIFELSISPVTDIISQTMEQQGFPLQHVIPAYVEIVLMEIVKQDDQNVIGDQALSNVVRIEVSGQEAANASGTATPQAALQPPPTTQGTPIVQPKAVFSAGNAAQVHPLAVWGNGAVRTATFAPDGQTIALGSGSGIFLYSAQSFALLRSIPTGSSVNALAYSPDGRILAVGADAGLFLYYPEKDQLLRETAGDGAGGVTSVAFSPDGERLAIGTSYGPSRIIHSASRETLRALDVAWVDDVAFSPDGQTLATACDKGIDLWDVATGKFLKNLDSGNTYSVAFSPDGKTLATGGRGVQALWDLESREVLHSFPWQISAIFSLAFSADGKTLVGGEHDGEVSLWEPQTLTALRTENGGSESITGLAISPDGKQLLAASLDGTLSLWDLGSGEMLVSQTGVGTIINDLAFSPDGTTLAAASYNQTVVLWNVASGQISKTLDGYGDRMLGVSYSPDGNTVVTVSNNSSVSLRESESGRFIRTIESSYARPVLSPDGTILAVQDWYKTIHLTHLSNGQPLRDLTGLTDNLISMAFSPDGKILAGGGYGATILLWDVANGQVLHHLVGHLYAVESIAFSPDGTLLASGSTDGSVILWDVTNGRILMTLKEEKPSDINAVAFSRDGTLLAAGSSGAVITLWDVGSGQVLAGLEGHTLKITSLAFSPDGTILASAGDDGTIRLWGVGD